ncbi:HNH endonuclease signature motif containing protein [Archangium sp.]|uniref:HNH endonuclease n=1 Tax=Archangium sp. TaxID=1872627 RepID=UPI002D7580E1|nr:HNH endonuclease signature motif containing protein [Archangium sp.]HYO52302.1 HNH endonuclease signature motif containing protein [Archangium sp.]
MHLIYLLLVVALSFTATAALPAAQVDGSFERLQEHACFNLETHAPDTAPSSFGDADAIAGGNRAGKSFTKTGKRDVKQKNASKNDGKNRCENCGVETVPAKKHEKDVTPPPNETHVDHVIPKAKGGPGEPDNGQVLCRECNLEKSDNAP